MRAAGVDVGDIRSVLLVAERAQYLAQHHLGKPDDRVERGAKLVADRGEKARFRPARRLGLFLREAQRVIGGLALVLQFDEVEAAVEHGQ